MRKDIVLVSNASMNIYPHNKLSDFRVRLPHPLLFDQSFKVAVTRISFTKSYFNFDFKPGERMISVILSENKAHYSPKPEDLAKCRLMARLLPGYYTPEAMVEMVNKCIADLKIEGTDIMTTFPAYKIKNGYLQCDPGYFVNASNNVIPWEVGFDPVTGALLGLGTEPIRPVFMNQGLTDLYIYSDLVYPTIVGDTTCELLCIVDGQTDKRYGIHCTEVFDEPWYQPLAKTQFQDIHVFIKGDSGQSPNFQFGRVVIRLTFRNDV